MNKIELFKQKSKQIKLLVFDFDGTLTDGHIYVTESGETSKKLYFKDIMGLSRLRKNGYKIGIISGDKSKIIDLYAAKLFIEDVYQGTNKKLDCLNQMMAKYNLTLENVCYMGDDINDIPVLTSVGLPVIVNNSNRYLKELENVFMTECDGGIGAVRELADCILEDIAPVWPA